MFRTAFADRINSEKLIEEVHNFPYKAKEAVLMTKVSTAILRILKNRKLISRFYNKSAYITDKVA